MILLATSKMAHKDLDPSIHALAKSSPFECELDLVTCSNKQNMAKVM